MHEFSTQKVLITHTTFFYYAHDFDMVYFMVKWSHFYNLPAGFLNMTPKTDMLKFSFFAETFQLLCLRKRENFTSTFYEPLKVIIP